MTSLYDNLNYNKLYYTNLNYNNLIGSFFAVGFLIKFSIGGHVLV